jgi:carboxypeptidase PM20D1
MPSLPAVTLRRLIVLSSLAVLLLLVAVVTARTLLFDSPGPRGGDPYVLPIDAEAAARRLSGAVQIATVSADPILTDVGPDLSAFHRLHAYLEKAFPRVHAALERQVIGGGALLYRWKGIDRDRAPVLLLGHLDTVPAENAAAWTYPPFSGAIASGFVWGRGTLDDKVAVLGILEATEYLLSQNFQPRRSIYFAFGHDEEISGHDGALAIARELEAEHLRFAFIIDEGLSVFTDLVPGLEMPAALIGTASKGYLTVRLTAHVEGGHSSMPPPETAVTVLAHALMRLSEQPLPAQVTSPLSDMLDALAPHMKLGYRLVMANRWLFEPFLRAQLSEFPAQNAMLRTTMAATMLRAGVRDNVLPSEASAVLNFRIHPANSVTELLEYVGATVDDPRVQVEEIAEKTMEPFGPTAPKAPGFELLTRVVRDVYPEVLVAPALFIGAADIRHYRGLSDELYTFHPLWLGPDDIVRYHGKDERIAIDNYRRYIAYYAHLMELAGGDAI